MLAFKEREAIIVISRNKIFVLCFVLHSYLNVCKGKNILISNTISMLEHTLSV